MSSRQQQIAPEQAVQQVQSTENAVTGPSNSEINGHLIESLFSKDYMVQPTDSTTVLVQSSNDKQINWGATWTAPNGFERTDNISQKGPSINIPFNFSEAASAGKLEHGDKVKLNVTAEYDGKRDNEVRDFIVKIPTEELQVWEVFFDNQDQNGDTDKANRLDPLVFDPIGMGS